MVKTLRITSVITVLLAMAIIALLVKYGVKTDENIENFLNAPEIIDVFKATSGNRPATPANQVHPLVQQAEAFALILEPPPPPQPIKTVQRPREIPVPEVKPKFTVKSTSYYPQNPELSLALIDEGKVTRWVRQSSTVNHLLIEQIKDGIVIVRNGEETFELKTPEKKFDISPIPIRGRTSPTTKNVVPPSSPAGRSSIPVSPRVNIVPKTESEDERKRKVEDLYLKLKMISEASNSGSEESQSSMEQKAVLMHQLIEDFKNSNLNLSEEESQKLVDLGEYLEGIKSSESEK